MRPSDVDELVDAELEFFGSNEECAAFQSFRMRPLRTTQRWQYGDEEHECFVVARDRDVQIVYCASGFGPSFPWCVQHVGETDLGTDGDWNAYLYESFITGMWRGDTPHGFELKGPGERTKT